VTWVESKCHPDRQHIAKGMCKVCYNRARRLILKDNPDRKYSNRVHNDAWKRTKKGRQATLLSLAKSGAKSKGREFSLDLSDIVIPDRCPVLGIPLDCTVKRPADNLPSLDRIDNSKGYIKGNVWVISWRANYIKRDSTLSELRSLVTALEAISAKDNT
jgi:hypothetical protein